MKHLRQTLLLLSTLSAVLMSLPFLVPKTSLLALVGLVPLLCLERIASRQGVKHIWLWYFWTFVLWNTLTVFWICNASFGGGIFAIVANSLQMSLVFALFRSSKKAFKGALPYIFLAALWLCWERWYFGTQISFPWLTLGHSFAGSPELVQWYSLTGTLGGSLWIWLCNLTVFGLICAKADGSMDSWTKWARRYCIAALIVLFPLPIFFSVAKYYAWEEPAEKLEVLIIQPNIDPYSKFRSLTQSEQDNVAENLIKEGIKGRDSGSTLLILTPETFTRYIETGAPAQHPSVKRLQALLSGRTGTNLLLGTASKTYYYGAEAPSILAYPSGENIWFTTHNSALLLAPDGSTQMYHKSKLVVGTELTPYPEFFVPIDNKLGGLMARDVGQDEISLFDVKSSDGGIIPIGCAICYESVYGEFCTGYIKKGARAMTIITNDAWWGDTPGYRQHFDYARLRAVELGRYIARCGNTGISGVINSRGDVVSASPWWEPCYISGSIGLSDEKTFFVRNGDIVGRVSTMLALLLLLAAVVRNFIPESLRK